MWPTGKISGDSEREWFEPLAPLPADLVTAAIEQAFRGGREWPPNGGQILALALDLAATDRPPMPEAPFEALDAWTGLLAALRDALPPDVFRTWIEPLHPLRLGEGRLWLCAPQHSGEWVRRRFGSMLDEAAGEISITIVEDPTEVPSGHSATFRRRV